MNNTMRPEYNQSPTKILRSGDISIASFLSEKDFNLDQKTVSSFGEEWQKFHQFNAEELNTAGNEYFDVVTDKILNQQSLVLDLGCGSGRWSYFIANKAGWIESVDPSDAVLTAAQLLKTIHHARVTQASVDNIPFQDDTFDLLICLGVLHHIPNTQQALNKKSPRKPPS